MATEYYAPEPMTREEAKRILRRLGMSQLQCSV